MPTRPTFFASAGLVLAGLLALVSAQPAAAQVEGERSGRQVYEASCAACHGADGTACRVDCASVGQ